MKHTLDAKDKKLGRLATEVAVLLMGKGLADYARNTYPEVTVTVKNVSKLDINDKRGEGTTYRRYSGYPGGLKIETLNHLSDRKGFSDAFKMTVYGMLPKNKLRSKMIKNLIITE